MSGVFLVLISPRGQPITESLRRRYDTAAARNELPPLRWDMDGSCAVALGPDVAGLGTGPLHVRSPRLSVIGNARLDNRPEVAAMAAPPCVPGRGPDLEVIARALDASGQDRIRDCLGDFALVTWDPATRHLHAARDAFGVSPLFHADRHDHLALSSRAALLAGGDEYDREYILTYLSGAVAMPDRTPYAGVHALPPGCMLTRTLGTSRITRYWSASDHVIDHNADDRERVESFRELFASAVISRMAEPGMTWAQLSGGLDSSSVVSLAQSLFEAGRIQAGVTGTVTIVDSLAQGDEREYTSEVLAKYGVPNHELVDDWLWRDDGVPPPLTDQPTLAYPFYARDRRMRDIVHAGGGRVLLSGEGADHYLTGSLHFLADLLARGQIAQAYATLRSWSATLRESFWRLGFQYGVGPLLPRGVRSAMVPAPELPSWLIVNRLEGEPLRDRLSAVHERPDSGHGRYAAEVNHLIGNVWQVLRADMIESSLELRYPYLDRRLIEFSLRLPPRLRSRPHERKWILRQAMRDVLPERVRTRTGKGGIEGRVPWSLAREQRRVADLLRDPILAELGFVEPGQLREAVVSATIARAGTSTRVLAPLSLEMWLRVRSGRYSSGDHVESARIQRGQSGPRLAASRS